MPPVLVTCLVIPSLSQPHLLCRLWLLAAPAGWDQDAADEAYRQQVEVLAQQQVSPGAVPRISFRFSVSLLSTGPPFWRLRQAPVSGKALPALNPKP